MKSDSSASSTSREYDPLRPDQNRDPYPVIAALLDECPVSRSDTYDLWVVAPYAEVRRGISEFETFSSKTPGTGTAATPEFCPSAREVLSTCPVLPPKLVLDDPPTHTNDRRPIQRALSVSRIQQMEPRVVDLAFGLLNKFKQRGEVEFIDQFAGPLPITVLEELLGIPPAMHGQFEAWADILALAQSAKLTEEEQISVAEVRRDTQLFIQSIIDDRRRNLRDDLVSDLIDATRPDGTRFSDLELLSILLQIVVAGHETTTSLLGSMFLILAKNPGMADELRDDKSLHERFIHETLRFSPPVTGRYRTTTTRTMVAGSELNAGDRVHFLISAANRDGRIFDDPSVFDLHRANVKSHLSFGFGVHFCVGSQLALLECKVALQILLPALSNLRLKEDFDEEWSKHFHFRGLTSLEIEFDPSP